MEIIKATRRKARRGDDGKFDLINSKWCRNVAGEARNTSTFHIGSFKNPLGDICRILCQLRTFSPSFLFCFRRSGEKGLMWRVCARRKIIWRGNTKRLSGGTGSHCDRKTEVRHGEMAEKWICFCHDKWHQWEIVSFPHLIIPFFVFHPRKKAFQRLSSSEAKRREMESREIAIWNSYGANKFYGKLYCGRSCSCEARAKKTHFLYSVSFHCWWSGTKSKFMPSLRFYSFWNVLQMLHIFSHFDFYRYARCFLLWLAFVSLLSLFMENCLSWGKKK